jgi:hypothetical protein
MSKEESRKHSIIQDASDQTVLLEVGLHNFVAQKLGAKFAESIKERVTVRPTNFQSANRVSADGTVSKGRQYDFVPAEMMVSGKASLQVALLECREFGTALTSAVAALMSMMATVRAESGDEKWTEAMSDLMGQAGMVKDPEASKSEQKNLKRWVPGKDSTRLIDEACAFAHAATGVAVWPAESEFDEQTESKSKPKYARYDCPTCRKESDKYEGITVRVDYTAKGTADPELMQKCGDRSMAVMCPVHETSFKLKSATTSKVAKLESENADLRARLEKLEEASVKAA